MIKFNSSTNYNADGEFLIIDLSSADTSGEYKFTISSNVKTCSFISNGKLFNKMRIVVSPRSGALILGFENIIFRPKKSIVCDGYDAIDAYHSKDLYINYKGIVEIYGGVRKDGNSCGKQYDKAENNETGRNGEDGVSGQRGKDGYNVEGNSRGIRNTSYVFKKEFVFKICEIE
ncbi:MAG: hypothetical protein K6G28_01200 [Acholeplasmatales bacterium]|nr:hypothetical protein [Acholeplasmatales bacterium]